MSRRVALIAVAAAGLFQAGSAVSALQSPSEEIPSGVVPAGQPAVLTSDLQRFQEALERRMGAEARKKEEQAAAKERKMEGEKQLKDHLEKRQEAEQARQARLKEVTEHRQAAEKQRMEELRIAKEEQARIQSKLEAAAAQSRAEKEQNRVEREHQVQQNAERRAQGQYEREQRVAERKLHIAQAQQEHMEALARAEARRVRSKMEFEVQEKLIVDAKAMREEREQAPLPSMRGRRGHKPTEGNLTAMVQAFASISNDYQQWHQWKSSGYARLQPQIARYVVGLKYGVAELVNTSTHLGNKELAQNLTVFVSSMGALLKAHQEEARAFVQSLEAPVNTSTREGLEPMMALIATEASPFTLAAPLNERSKRAMCASLSSVVAPTSPYYMALQKSFEELNATAQQLPFQLNKTTGAPKAKDVANLMVELAYAETLGLREASHEVASKLAPLLAERFHCAFHMAK